MKKISCLIFIFCGLLLQQAAFPVFGQSGEPVSGVRLNKKPLNDLADFALEKVEKDKVDLSQPFKVVLEGSLTRKIENGFELVVLDKQKTKWLAFSNEEAGNAETVEIAKKAIEAVGESGVLGHFYNLGVKDVKIVFYQNESTFAISLESKQETAERAKIISSGLNAFLMIARTVAKTDEEKTLIGGFQMPTVNDKTFTINFKLPKNTIQEIINRNLTNYKNRKLSEQK